MSQHAGNRERPRRLCLKSDTITPAADVVESLKKATSNLAGRIEESFSYPAPEGTEEIRERVTDAFRLATPVVITNSSTEALNLCLGSLEGPIAVQTPAYFGVWRALGRLDLTVHEFASMDELRKFFETGKARHIYINSNFNGLWAQQITDDEKSEIASLARTTGGVVIEDNPVDPLFFGEGMPKRVADQYENTLYISSISKILGPGIRLGFVSAGEEALGRIKSAKITASLGAPWHTQAIAAAALTPEVLEAARADAKRRSRVAGQILCAGHMDRWAMTGGSYLYLETRKDPGELVKKLRSLGVDVDDNRFNQRDGTRGNYLRINIGAPDIEDLPEAMSIFHQEWTR